MEKKKTYILMLSEFFPKTHNKAGMPTEFKEKVLNKKKIHTIRANFPLWEKRIKEVQEGRESVVENVPELKWRKEICRDKYFLEAYALGAYYLIILRGSEFHVVCNYRHFASYTSLTVAKQAAKEHYKELIKQALGV